MIPYPREELDTLQSKFTKRYTEKEKEETIERFKKAHPKLMAFQPRVYLDLIKSFSSTDVDTIYEFDPPVPVITIYRPLIIDTRLIPKDFENIAVTTFISFSDVPPELTKKDEHFFDYNELVKYVEKNFDKIRFGLNEPDISVKDAVNIIRKYLL